MGTIREYQNKITSLRNTRKITGSMKMISSIKLQRMNRLRSQAAPFIAAIRRTDRIIGCTDAQGGSPYVSGRKRADSIHVLLITGDRGLCGRFNMNTIRAMMKRTAEVKGRTVTFSSIGHKGHHFLRRRSLDVQHFYENGSSHPSWETAREIGTDLLHSFTAGNADEVWMVFSRRAGSFSEEPVVERLLPLQRSEEKQDAATDYLLEGSAGWILEQAVLLRVQADVYRAMLDSSVAEHAARMSAMDNATSNCDRLLGQYVQLRNRARQAVITTELNEIVTGKEALES